MFQLQRLPYLFCTLIIVCFGMISFCGIKSNAMKVEFYSYKKVKAAMPKQNQNNQYIYNLENGDTCITFATYNGNDYKTSVKKTVGKNDFLYCIDYTRHITFQKNYEKISKFFNQELSIRIAIAMEYGTTRWGKKASKEFTTDNFILDYYMTQLVIHSLIYDFGDTKSNYGINYKSIKFKSDTGKLKKKTDAFYMFCSNADIKNKEKYFKTSKFSFEKPENMQLLLKDTKFETPFIKCKIGKNNAAVSKFTRTVSSKTIDKADILLNKSSDKYNADVKISILKSKVDKLSSGNHLISLSENVDFTKEKTLTWHCTDKAFKNINQSVCGTVSTNATAKDSIEFNLLIGEVVLHKKDSITGENITDAEFQILQYNDSKKTYEFYKNMTYNSQKKYYESGNIYLSSNNPSGKFKIIESKPGKNYLNDWKGEEFQITKDIYLHEFHVENQPILGKLRIKKYGESVSFQDGKLTKSNNIFLEGVKFSLYAEEDIYLKGKVFYPKNKLIAELTTDENGEINVENLLPGKYYLKEVQAPFLYVVDEKTENFTVIFDKQKDYNDTNLQIVNRLKKCEIKMFKYYYSKDNKEQKLPLSGAKIGLYAGEDIVNGNSTIIKKDTLIQAGISDKNGFVSFKDLLYADYYLKEIEAPEGFLLNDVAISVSKNSFLQKKISNEDYNSYISEVRMENQPILGSLKIEKVGEHVIFQKNAFKRTDSIKLSGVKFELYSKNDIYLDGKIIYAKDQKIKELTTDKNGEIYVASLYPGDYYLKETDNLFIYALDEKVINVSVSGEQTVLSVENLLKKCNLQLFKYYPSKDNSEEKIPLSNAKFGLYTREDFVGGDGKVILKKDSLVDVKTSNGAGMIEFKDLLYGDYYLKELEAPKDFMISDGILLVSKKDFSLKRGTNFQYTSRIEFVNKKCLAQFKITKFGEVPSSFQKRESENGEFFSYEYDKLPLEGVTFSLYDKEKKLIASKTTDDTGIVSFTDLEPGEYYYKEESGPDIYLIEDNFKPVVVDVDNKQYNETAPPLIEKSLNNELCSCLLSVRKFGEQAVVEDKSLVYKEVPLKDVIFGIYQNFDYTFPSGEKLVKNSCVGYLVTDESGKAKFCGKLPLGSYYIKELKTNPGYQIDEKTYPFEVATNNNKEIVIPMEEKLHLLNILSKASVRINKTDENTGKKLKNVEFTLYNDQNEQLGVYKTDGKGKIIVENLPYGTYYFIETKCKNGYYSTNNKYKFILESEDQVVLDITNAPILKLGFTEHYKLGLAAVFVLIFFIFVFGIANLKKKR